MTAKQKITPCLWFDGRAEEAVNFYLSIFPAGKIKSASRYGEQAAKASGQPVGSVMVMTFELDGQGFMALNGGPMYKFTPAISMMVDCASQAEVDHYWDKLSAGGETSRCGWLKDKFGVSWQIVPSALGQLMGGPDAEKSKRVMQAMLQMSKIEIAKLEAAAGARI